MPAHPHTRTPARPHALPTAQPMLRVSSHLVCLATDEDAHDLAEEASEQRVETVTALQEAIEPVQEGLICTQGIVDLGHIRGQDLTGHTRVPGK
ncbi:hypothetical protein NN561_020311 [Cricetulus griseus]